MEKKRERKKEREAGGREKREGKRGEKEGANDQHQFFTSHFVNYVEREL